MKKKWVFKEQNNKNFQNNLTKELNIHPGIAQILVNRGIDNPIAANSFLNPELKNMYDPFLMKDMDKAVNRIIKAINKKEYIYIYGDYDVDGVTGASLLLLFFKDIEVPVHYYIPDRINEGYGLNIEGLKKVKDKGADLIITVDCGIDSFHEVEEAKKLGMDMIITDHHHVPSTLPNASAILNPAQKDCNYPCKFLSGVGVAYKLIKALRIRLREEKSKKNKLPNLKRYLDLVAMGTIADIVPFKDENRILIKHGLNEIKNTEKTGLLALKSVSGIDDGPIEVYDIGFKLAPRLNASGRISSSSSSVELLISKDKKNAYKIAEELDSCNKERQMMQQKVLIDVKNKIASEVNLKEDKVIVLSSSDWHPGIIGIVASKIIDDFYRPTILISLDGDKGRGSARSISSFHIYEGLKECTHLLNGFGGHRMAAGLNINKNNIDEFRNLFNDIVLNNNNPDDFIPKIDIDTEISLDELTIPFINNLQILKPHGPSNPQPIFFTKDISIEKLSLIGKNKEHIKFTLKNSTLPIEAIGFNMAKKIQDLFSKNETFDIVYSPQINEWKGNRKIQLKLKDLEVSSA